MFPLRRTRKGFTEDFLERAATDTALEVISEILGASDWNAAESNKHKNLMRELGQNILTRANSELARLLA